MTTEQGLLWLVGTIRKIPKRIPILLWDSIPCTGGSPWTRVNLARCSNTFPARLRLIRNQWGKMLSSYSQVCDIIRQRGGYWALEWSSRCAYWDSPIVKQFLRRQKEPLYEATAVGCAYGLRAETGPLQGHPMSKAWLVNGNLPLLPSALERSCHCAANTVHAQASGDNTEIIGKYTPSFVAAVHSLFARTVAHRSVHDPQ